MRRLTDPPKVQEFAYQLPRINAWIATVTDRFNLYESAADPTIGELPEKQWVIHRNTTTGDITLWTRYGATLYSINGDVRGPAGAVADDIAVFDGASGKLIKDGGKKIADLVPITRTVNGHALSADVTVTKADVGLGNVTNDAQTKEAIVPNTVPTAGQVLVGNAANTAYAAVTMSGDGTLASTGAITITKLNGKTVTLAGNLTTAGAFASTFTMTGVTTVTFPTSGTLATVNGALGTPTSVTLTNGTGLPISTGVSGLGANVATFLATPSSANLAAAVTDETGTGALVFANTPTLVTPNIGAATGTSLTATGTIVSTGTAGIGYGTGAGGTVTQITSKATNVTLNKITGQVTMHNAALAANTEVQFAILNSTVNGGVDHVHIEHLSGGTYGAYFVQARSAVGGIAVSVRNLSAGSLSEAIVLGFSVIKAVTS